MREDIFKKNMHTQLTTWKKNANIKNLPPPPITFLMVRPLVYAVNMYCRRFVDGDFDCEFIRPNQEQLRKMEL
jgi:hypothetical protein